MRNSGSGVRGGSALALCCAGGAGGALGMGPQTLSTTAFGVGWRAVGTDATVAGAVCAGAEAVAETVRTGAGCFGFAAKSVLGPREATWSFCAGVGAGAAFERPNQLPIIPAIEVGFVAGASPCFGRGAGRGIGTLAITTGSVSVCGAVSGTEAAVGAA